MLNPLPKIVVSGASGFIGSTIIGQLGNEFEFCPLNIDDYADKKRLMDSMSGAKAFLHLAGISSVADCEKNPRLAYDVNVGLSCYLAELYFRSQKNGHFIFPSTAHVYQELEKSALKEDSPLKPNSTYARTKLSAEAALTPIANSLQGGLTILRLFNHTHISQPTEAFLPSIYRQLRTLQNQQPVEGSHKLRVGNIDIDRDFSSVQDLTRALKLVLQSDRTQGLKVYNLCSGVPKNLRQILEEIFKRMHLRVEIEVDAARVRADEPKVLVGNPSQFCKDFGWKSKSLSISTFVDQIFSET